MKYEIDPELAPALAELKRGSADAPRPVRGDWQAVRASANAGQAYMATLSPIVTDVTTTDFATETFDGETTLLLRWYAKTGKTPGPAVVYVHGGGMLGGSVDLYDEVVAWYVAHSGIPFLSVDLRLAPEAPTSTAMAEDVYSALIWLREHAPYLGVNPGRIALMGDSGGGGPTAGAAILARDRNIPIAKQILIYPMLDDRNTTPGVIPDDLLTWGYDNNYTGWATLLGNEISTEDVSPIAAPARLTDFAGLAPAYIEVGDLDIFRDEDISYAARLARHGVPIELHVHPGAPHGFERFVPDSDIARRAMADRVRAITNI
ncbi:alpha/beta hydrolase [Mycetocola tolaasinivorans]|uniref:Alpha/beta hydrolase n=1 Tax=Mycetocola tolaasinivorans TaxID=76635 RepID=A0A3L7A9C2_9MICO|nr:alpha/beta hydrolase [Mycetocola tolaasinivorans]RLP76996.1 alpha/beta hydrolase [Mycetocola tolaasinivorans]